MDLEIKQKKEWPTRSRASSELQGVQTIISEAKYVAEDENDNENRRNNIILYSIAELLKEMWKVNIRTTKVFFLQLMNVLGTGFDEEDITIL